VGASWLSVIGSTKTKNSRINKLMREVARAWKRNLLSDLDQNFAFLLVMGLPILCIFPAPASVVPIPAPFQRVLLPITSRSR